MSFFNRKETAELLKISLPTLHKLTKEGTIPCIKLGRLIRYRESDIQSLEGTAYTITQTELGND